MDGERRHGLNCDDPNCEGYSPEQEAFLDYWTKVLDRVRDPDKFVLTVSSKKEVDEYFQQKLDQEKRRKEMGWSTPGLCESCQFIPGICPDAEMNKRRGRGKSLPKVLACSEYLPGEKLVEPPDIKLEERVPIVLDIDVEMIKKEEWVILTVADWNKKANQYVISRRGKKRSELPSQQTQS